MVDVPALLKRLDTLEKTVARLEAENATLRAENQRLHRKVGDLEAHLTLNPFSSSKPPSSHPISVSKRGHIRDPNEPAKLVGAQEGHPGHARRWFPPDEVSKTIAIRPTS